MQTKKKIKVNQDIKPLLNDDPIEEQDNGPQKIVEESKVEEGEDGKSQVQRNREVNSTS